MASMIVAGLLQYLPCLLGPQHEIQVAHGDINGLGEFFHFCFCGQVLPFGQGLGKAIYDLEPFQVFEYMPVENCQVLVEADVSEKFDFTTNFQPEKTNALKGKKQFNKILPIASTPS